MVDQQICTQNIGKGKAGTVENILKKLVALLRRRTKNSALGGIRSHLAGEGVELAGWGAVVLFTGVDQAIPGCKRRAMQVGGLESCCIEWGVPTCRRGPIGDGESSSALRLGEVVGELYLLVVRRIKRKILR